MTCMGADGNDIVRPAKACCASLHERRSNARQHSQSAIDVAAANLRPLVPSKARPPIPTARLQPPPGCTNMALWLMAFSSA